MILDVPTREEVEEVRRWRNEELQFLRTPYRLTPEMQRNFYDTVISNRDSPHRYYGLYHDGEFVGFGGLTNIDYINGHTEVSLIIHPEHRGAGYGKEAVELLLKEAYHSLRMNMVYGEVYRCGNWQFWEKIIANYGGHGAILEDRKFWDGKYWDSIYFSLTKKQWRGL